MSGLPATFTSGFGIVSVSGRIRVPSPAASTMAQRGVSFGGALICQTFNAGTLVRYQAASAAKDGCASDLCR
jgi:hypothetical protein